MLFRSWTKIRLRAGAKKGKGMWPTAGLPVRSMKSAKGVCRRAGAEGLKRRYAELFALDEGKAKGAGAQELRRIAGAVEREIIPLLMQIESGRKGKRGKGKAYGT